MSTRVRLLPPLPSTLPLVRAYALRYTVSARLAAVRALSSIWVHPMNLSRKNLSESIRIDRKSNNKLTENRSKFSPGLLQGWSNYQEKNIKKHVTPILNRSKKRPKFNRNSTQMAPGSASGRVLEASWRNGERVFEKKVPF